VRFVDLTELLGIIKKVTFPEKKHEAENFLCFEKQSPEIYCEIKNNQESKRIDFSLN
jgi:hypothetical protein